MTAKSMNLHCPKCGASLDLTQEIADAVAKQVAAELARLAKERLKDERDQNELRFKQLRASQRGRTRR
jgi:hypothetical protein